MLKILEKKYILEIYNRVQNKFEKTFSLKEPFNEIQLYLPNIYDHCQNIIINTKTFYEIKYLNIVNSRYIPKDSIIVDVGSNIGNHLVFFSKISNAKKVYGFEPQIDVFNILETNKNLNECNAQIKNLAIGDRADKAKIAFLDKKNLGATALKYDEEGSIETSTLDDEFKNLKDKIDFIKIDVEGFEYFVLKGGKTILLNHKPTIWVEVFNKNFYKINELLNSFNYEIKDCLGKYNYIYVHK